MMHPRLAARAAVLLLATLLPATAIAGPADGKAGVARIEQENAGDLTPEKIAQLEHEAAAKGESDRVLLDEEASPTAGRRFTRA